MKSKNNHLNKSEISLGQALAYVKAMGAEVTPKGKKLLSDSAQNYINSLCHFRNDLNNDQSLQRIFAGIPEYTCQSSKSFLTNNFKFFIALLLLHSENYSCEKLIKHLNSCYSCFDVFCQVLRDYFHTTNDIIRKTEV
jgi:hypothetical protein